MSPSTAHANISLADAQTSAMQRSMIYHGYRYDWSTQLFGGAGYRISESGLRVLSYTEQSLRAGQVLETCSWGPLDLGYCHNEKRQSRPRLGTGSCFCPL